MVDLNQSHSVDPGQLNRCMFSFVSGFSSLGSLGNEDLFLKNKINSKEMSLIASPSEALALVKDGTASKVVIEVSTWEGKSFTYLLFEQKSGSGRSLLLRGVEVGKERDEFISELRSEGVEIRPEFISLVGTPPIETPPVNETWYSPLVWPTALVASAVLFSRGIRGVARQAAWRKNNDLRTFGERPPERFEDIGGNQTTVRELRHIVEDISRYQEGDETVRLPRGVLFYGPPGTGKTFNARVVCGEANCRMFYLNASDLTSSPWLGSWVVAVNRAFEHARIIRDRVTSEMRAGPEATGQERAVVVIFIDELDSLARRRSVEVNSESGGEHLRAVNTFLAQLDGVDQKLNEGIVIMGATNHLESLDPALLRPGRLGVRLKLSPPATAAERLDILQKISKKVLVNRQMHLADDAVLEDLSQITHSLSADHLRGIMERAVELAYRNHTDIVAVADIFEAYQETCFGHAHDSLLKEEALVRVGAHEHGHGLVAIACKCRPLVVSMRPRGESAGRIVINDHPLLEVIPTRVDMLRALLIAAGGRAGERVNSGPRGASVGVEGDFARMEEIALKVFRSGLLGDEFAIHALNAKLSQLPMSQQGLISKLRQAALNAAEKIVRELPREVFDALVRDSLCQNAELVGQEARNYYDGRLGKDTISAMEGIAEAFIDAPFSFCTPSDDSENIKIVPPVLAA